MDRAQAAAHAAQVHALSPALTLQVSSAFGRKMETVDQPRLAEALDAQEGSRLSHAG